MSVFRQIVPNSVHNENNSRYEYLLSWLSISGGVRSWLFSSTNGGDSDGYKNFTVESTDDIRSTPTEQRKTVSARTGSLDLETLEYVKSIMASNRVYTVTKAGAKTPVAIKAGSVGVPNKLKEFSFGVNFVFQEENILNL